MKISLAWFMGITFNPPKNLKDYSYRNLTYHESQTNYTFS